MSVAIRYHFEHLFRRSPLKTFAVTNDYRIWMKARLEKQFEEKHLEKISFHSDTKNTFPNREHFSLDYVYSAAGGNRIENYQE